MVDAAANQDGAQENPNQVVADTAADGAQTPERGLDRFGSCFDLEESIGLVDATNADSSKTTAGVGVSSGKADDPDLSTPTGKMRKKPTQPVPPPRNKMPQRSNSEPRSDSKAKARAKSSNHAAEDTNKGRPPTKSHTLERARPTASEREASVVEEVAERGLERLSVESPKSVESQILQRVNAEKAAVVRSPTPTLKRRTDNIAAQAIASEPTVAAASATTNAERAKSAQRVRNAERNALEGQIAEGAGGASSTSSTANERRRSTSARGSRERKPARSLSRESDGSDNADAVTLPQRAQTASTMNVGAPPRSALAGDPAAQGKEEKLPWRASIDDISRVGEAISERKQYEINR